MTEFIPPEGYRDGHLPDLQNVILDLYRLLTIFLASEQLARMRTDLANDPIGILQQFEIDEITRILVNSAVVARIVDERDGYFLGQYETDCGILVTNLNEPDITTVLTLRESCNKIIHANKIRFDLEDANGLSYMNPKMYFYGVHRGSDWKASISIIDFVTTYTTILGNQ